MAMRKVVNAADLTPEELAEMETYMAEEARFERGRFLPPVVSVPGPYPLAPKRWLAPVPADIDRVVAASLTAAGMPSRALAATEIDIAFYRSGDFGRETEKWEERVPDWVDPSVGLVETEAHESVVDRVAEVAMASEEVHAWSEAEGEVMMVEPNSPFITRED